MKNITKYALAAVLALCIAAANAAEPVNQPAKSEKAAAEQKVAVQSTETVKLSSGAVIEKLREWDKNLQTLDCSFTQHITFGDSGMANTIEGLVRYRKPNLLRVEHTAPQKQIVVTDKVKISIYKPQDKQLVKTDWKSWINQQSAMFSGITNFGDYSKILSDHEVKVAYAKDTVSLELAPKDGKKKYTLTLVLGTDNYFPREINMKIGTTDVKTALKNTKLNAAIPDGVFTITPPAGTSVIDF